MIAAAVLVLAIGVADVARLALGALLGWRWARPLGGLLAVVTGATVGLLLGLGGWSAVVLLAVPWLVATRPGARRAAVATVGLTAVVVLSLLALGAILPQPAGPIDEWYQRLPYPALADVPITTAVAGVAWLAFLIESANVVVRLALAPVASKDASQQQSPGRTVLFRSPEDLLELPLPGGRLIGPLERVLILVLALAGQFTAIGAVVAAKGIIRFPEISKDTAGGSKAEFFIVGSLASWTLVAASVAFIALGVG